MARLRWAFARGTVCTLVNKMLIMEKNVLLQVSQLNNKCKLPYGGMWYRHGHMGMTQSRTMSRRRIKCFLFELWDDLNRKIGKQFEPWVNPNQYLRNPLESWVDSESIPGNPLESWGESIQVFEILLESWPDSNQGTWVECPKTVNEI